MNGLTDAQLVTRYAREASQEAFAELAYRHGAMVHGVCLRVLGNASEAEDAAQAVFMLLARKAGSLKRRGAVAGWLYGAANLVARRHLRTQRRRARAEKEAIEMRKADASGKPAAWDRLRPELDAALTALPRRSRDAVVLVHLQDRTQAEAARELGVPVGTVKSRVSLALEKLRQRLAGRGLALGAAAIGTAISGNAAPALPAGLAARLAVAGTGAAAAAASATSIQMMEGAMKAMAWAKIKVAAAVIVAATALAGGGTLAVRGPAAGEPRGRRPAAGPAGAPLLAAAPARMAADETQASAQFQLVDFNGDGLKDIVQLSAGGDRGWVFVNRGTKKQPYFDFYERLPTNYSELHGTAISCTVDQWLCDFDGDGDLDVLLPSGKGLLLCINTGDSRHSCLWTGKLLAKLSSGGPLWMGWDDQARWNKWVITRKVATLCAADADGDGKPDVYAQPPSGGLLLYKNTSKGRAHSVSAPAAVKDTAGKPLVARSPFPVDFNGDGALDIISTAHQKGVSVFLGVKGMKGLVFKPALAARDEAGKPIPGGNDVELFDWNADGVLDLLVLDDSCAIRCHLGKEKGKPIFASKALPVHGRGFGRIGEAQEPQLRDMDGDGRSDLLLGGGYDLHCSGATPWMRAYKNVLPAGPCTFGRGDFVWQGALPLRGGNPFVSDFDADGKLDVLYWAGRKGKQVSIFLRRGTAGDPRKTGEKAVKLVTVTCDNRTYPHVRPMAVDWNGDGATDIVTGAYAYNWARVLVYINKGTSKAPKFGDPVELSAGGKVITEGSPCIVDWDRDGKLDLLLSGGRKRAPLRWCRNVSKTKTPELAAPVEIKVGTPPASAPLTGGLSAGDVDGDGVTDLVISRRVNDPNGAGFLWHSELWMLRGTAGSAPGAVRDLKTATNDKNSVTLTWTAPRGAAKCELRYSTRPIDEITWFRATPAAKGPAPGARQFQVGGLEAGRVYYFALSTYGPKGQRSAVSNCVRGVTAPLKEAHLVQGQPARGLGVAVYKGCADAQVRGGVKKSLDGKGLVVQSTKSKVYCHDSYIKFDLSPLAGRKIKKAWLTLTASRPLAKWVPLRCREVKVAWDPQTVRYETREGKTPWKPADYGKTAIEASPNHLHGRKRWDVTDLVLGQLKDKKLLNLHISDAPLITRTGQHFHDSEAADPAVRPRLTVLFE